MAEIYWCIVARGLTAFWSVEGWQAKIHWPLSKSLTGWKGSLVGGMMIPRHLSGVAHELPAVSVVETDGML
jgi:hypothetical protein